MTLPVEYTKDLTQKIAYDESGRPEYIGSTAPGNAATAAAWQIKKITYDGDGYQTDIQFAAGTKEFIHVWNSRETYTYA